MFTASPHTGRLGPTAAVQDELCRARHLVHYPHEMITRWSDVEWGGFGLLPPELLVPPRNIDRKEARKRHRKRLDSLPGRLATLDEVAEANGVVFGPRGLRDCGSLESWLHGVAMRHGELLEKPREPLMSLVHDTAMLFGDELIARYPTLGWQLKVGNPRKITYHHTVLGGFSRARFDYDAELIFSHLADLRGEFFGDSHRDRWPAIIAIAEKYA